MLPLFPSFFHSPSFNQIPSNKNPLIIFIDILDSPLEPSIHSFPLLKVSSQAPSLIEGRSFPTAAVWELETAFVFFANGRTRNERENAEKDLW